MKIREQDLRDAVSELTVARRLLDNARGDYFKQIEDNDRRVREKDKRIYELDAQVKSLSDGEGLKARILQLERELADDKQKEFDRGYATALAEITARARGLDQHQGNRPW